MALELYTFADQRDKMEERITEILQRSFAGSSVALERDSDGDRVYGHILWNGFARHSFLWRQNKLVRVLKRELGPEMNGILHIFTYTPNEYEQMMSVE